MATATQTVPFTETDPATVARWLKSGECTLIDVREPDEHARERINGARLSPLSSFAPATVATTAAKRIVFHCKSGRRSADAAQQASAFIPAGVEVHSMKGGIEAWKGANLPVEVNANAPRMSIMRQVQFTIGLGILTGLAIGYFAHPLGYLLSAFMACGLVMAGLTGACPLAAAVARLPWNRLNTSDGCAAGECN